MSIGQIRTEILNKKETIDFLESQLNRNVTELHMHNSELDDMYSSVDEICRTLEDYKEKYKKIDKELKQVTKELYESIITSPNYSFSQSKEQRIKKATLSGEKHQTNVTIIDLTKKIEKKKNLTFSMKSLITPEINDLIIYNVNIACAIHKEKCHLQKLQLDLKNSTKAESRSAVNSQAPNLQSVPIDCYTEDQGKKTPFTKRKKYSKIWGNIINFIYTKIKR